MPSCAAESAQRQTAAAPGLVPGSIDAIGPWIRQAAVAVLDPIAG